MRVNFICCVYKITSPSKKVYVGSSIDFRERISTYKSMDCAKQPRLYNSFKKYGFDKHKIEILERCEEKDVRQKEHYYGHLFDCLGRNGLNCKLPKYGEGFVSISQELRDRIGAAKKGNTYTKGRKYGAETRMKISASKKGISNGPHSKETRIKMSNKAMGGNNHKAILLLNTNTGIFYECFQDAAFSMNMKYNTFRSRLYHKRSMPFMVA